MLGLDELAQDSLNVLVLNYPKHPSVGSNGEFISSYTAAGPERSAVNKLTLGLFDQPRPPAFDNRPADGSY